MSPVGVPAPRHAEAARRPVAIRVAQALGVVLADAEVAVLLVGLLLVAAAGQQPEVEAHARGVAEVPVQNKSSHARCGWASAAPQEGGLAEAGRSLG